MIHIKLNHISNGKNETDLDWPKRKKILRKKKTHEKEWACAKHEWIKSSSGQQ